MQHREITIYITDRGNAYTLGFQDAYSALRYFRTFPSKINTKRLPLESSNIVGGISRDDLTLTVGLNEEVQLGDRNLTRILETNVKSNGHLILKINAGNRDGVRPMKEGDFLLQYFDGKKLLVTNEEVIRVERKIVAVQ